MDIHRKSSLLDSTEKIERDVWKVQERILWNVVSGALLHTLTGHSHHVLSVAFSPDGTRVVSGSSDNTFRLYNAASGAHVETFTRNGHTNFDGSVVAYCLNLPQSAAPLPLNTFVPSNSTGPTFGYTM